MKDLTSLLITKLQEVFFLEFNLREREGLTQNQRKQFKRCVVLPTPLAIVGMESARVAPQQSSILSPLDVILSYERRKINRAIFGQKCNNFLAKNVLDLGSTVVFVAQMAKGILGKHHLSYRITIKFLPLDCILRASLLKIF